MLFIAVCGLTLAALAAADASPLPASPDSWLSPDGHSAEWAAATSPCRELLDGVDFDKPLVSRHRGKLEATVKLLRRTESFDWRSGVAVGFLRAMLDDLAAGAEPNCRYTGGGVAVPYWSATLKRVEAVWVHVPPEYRPGRSYQMFMYYKCGGGIHLKDGKVAGGYRPTADVANRTDTFHVWSSLSTQVKGRKGAVHELREVVAALAMQFGVDPDAYILDPRANHFGACDWLHLGFSGNWQEIDGGRSRPFRYVLSVGLRRGDGPDLAPPRDRSKEFVELDLDGAARPEVFRFETLGKGLPVDATIDVKRFSIVPGKGGEKLALAGAGESDAVGRVALVRVRLENRCRHELTALAAVSTEALMRVDPNVIRVPPGRGQRPDLVGILTDFRLPGRAAALMRPADAEDVQQMVLPGAGWNFGLYGLKTRLTLAPGRAAAVPLLLVAVEEAADGAEPDLRSAEHSPLILLRPYLRELVSGGRK